jgi:hypothetical protein
LRIQLADDRIAPIKHQSHKRCDRNKPGDRQDDYVGSRPVGHENGPSAGLERLLDILTGKNTPA